MTDTDPTPDADADADPDADPDSTTTTDTHHDSTDDGRIDPLGPGGTFSTWTEVHAALYGVTIGFAAAYPSTLLRLFVAFVIVGRELRRRQTTGPTAWDEITAEPHYAVSAAIAGALAGALAGHLLAPPTLTLPLLLA